MASASVGHRAPSVQLDGGGFSKERFDGLDVTRDLRLLFWRFAVRVIQDNMLEAVIEAALVLHGPRPDHLGAPGQQLFHAGLVPRAVGQAPPVIVGIHGEASAAAKLGQDCGLSHARHPGHQHPCHGDDHSDVLVKARSSV